jgi:RNA polymerase sigma factor (sigma-70 family)
VKQPSLKGLQGARRSPRDGRADDPQSLWIRKAVERYEVPLIQYAARMLGDADLARDVVQDAFLKMWTADRASVDGHLGQWLYRVCRNRALDVCRKEDRMTTLTEHNLEARDTTSVDGEHATSHAGGTASLGIMVMLNSLPDRQQEVLRLKFQGGLSYQQIANVMDLTSNHVGVLIHTAIKTLRERFAGSEPAAESTGFIAQSQHKQNFDARASR